MTFDLLTWISIGVIYSSRTIYLPSLKLLGQSVLELSVAKGEVDWHDLWPTDLNINRGHLLIKDYLPTKFEASGAKHPWVISCTRLRDTDILTDRHTSAKQYAPPFSKGGITLQVGLVKFVCGPMIQKSYRGDWFKMGFRWHTQIPLGFILSAWSMYSRRLKVIWQKCCSHHSQRYTMKHYFHASVLGNKVNCLPLDIIGVYTYYMGWESPVEISATHNATLSWGTGESNLK